MNFYIFYAIKNSVLAILQKIIAAVPLFFTAVGVTLGVILYWYGASYWITIVLFFFVCFFLFIVCYFAIHPIYEYKLHGLLLPMILVFFGFFAAYRQNKEFLRLQQLLSGKEMHVQCIVRDIEKTKNPVFPYEITLITKNCSFEGIKWFSCSTNIKIMTRQYGSLSVGDFIELPITTSDDVDTTTPFAYYLMKEGLAAYLFIPIMKTTRLKRPLYSFARFLYRKRTALYKAIEKNCSEKTMIFFKMLFLGKKEHCDESTRIANCFQYWGIVHMTARSGLHMTLFSSLCTIMLQCIPLPFFLKNILLLIVFFIYALFSYSSVSFIRAFATSICILLCHCITRRTDFLHVTLVVYIVQLLINPITLFFLDFQLSFLLTIGIGFFFKKYFYGLLI